jgi:hypothetical protein
MDFHLRAKWQDQNVNTTKAPGSWKEKQPVGKMCSQWLGAAVIPSNSMLGFACNNKPSTERKQACSAVLVVGKSQPAAMGTD